MDTGSLIHTGYNGGIVPSGSGNGFAILQNSHGTQRRLRLLHEFQETIDHGLINQVPSLPLPGLRVQTRLLLGLKFAKGHPEDYYYIYSKKTLQWVWRLPAWNHELETEDGMEKQGLLNSVWQRRNMATTTHTLPSGYIDRWFADVTILGAFAVLDVPSAM